MNSIIHCTIQSPVKCTREQYIEWLRYQLVGGTIGEDNPLYSYDICGCIDNLEVDGEEID